MHQSVEIRSSTDAPHTYRAKDVALHASADDCWVIVNGRVYDVTKFLSSHPGGAQALSKPGRAGCDVTPAFERIGHSAHARALLETMLVGVLDDDRADAVATHEADAERYAAAWHAARRKAITLAHPEVARLAERRPQDAATPLIALAAAVLHAGVCAAATHLPLGVAVLLGYTVGAFFKMTQFAMLHDICHGSAGEYVRGWFARVCCFHLLSLPSMGGETQMYYAYQHLGHHTNLGQDYHEIKLAEAKAAFGIDVKAPAESEPKGRAPRWFTQLEAIVARPALQKLDEFDGDVPAVGSMLLLIGSLADVANASTWIEKALGPAWYPILGPLLNPVRWPAKIFFVPAFQLFHFFWMLLPAEIIMGIVANPLVCAVALAAMRLPERWVAALLGCGVRERGRAARLVAALRRRYADWLFVLLDFGVHTWLWAGSLAAILAAAGGSWGCGLAYIAVAELCMHGFAWHPFLGYFLGVHRSPLPSDAESGKECQPTTSTYSCLTSLSCWNLNYHVEHHDFPIVPWSRLPAIRAAAPEFYDDLESSTGFYSTIWRWLGEGHTWTYACVSAGSVADQNRPEQERGALLPRAGD